MIQFSQYLGYLCLNRFTRLAGSELVEGALNLIEGFETASTQFYHTQRRRPEQG